MTLQTYYGNTDPLQGWYSDAYGSVQKNHVVGYTERATSTTYATLIALGPDAGRPASVTESTAPDGALTLRVCAADTSVLAVIAHPAASGEHVTVGSATGCPHGN